MLDNGADTYTYDSANRLITAGGHTYTYNAEDIRIRDLCLEEDTAYTYNNNCKLSKLLMKTSGGTVTKYVYGRGLIGEETGSEFKTYHFDCRGSTVAITDISGNITDTFAYDTYGRLTTRTGSTPIIFGYNGRNGVITDKTGLIYMRARYYSPDMKRFINADVVAGKLSKAITLNRYAYANGNPVSLTDPFGLSPERGEIFSLTPNWSDIFFPGAEALIEGIDWLRRTIYKHKYNSILSVKKPKKISRKNWLLKTSRKLAHLDDAIGTSSKFAKGLSTAGKVIDIAGDVASVFSIAWDTGMGVTENIENGTRTQKIVSDAIVDTSFGAGITAISTSIGSAVGSLIPIPVVGTLIGGGAGYVFGEGLNWLVNADLEFLGGKSVVDWVKDGAAAAADWIVEDLPDIAANVWNATTDFVEDTGEWIADTASDVWDATTDFVEDAGEWISDTASDVWDATTDFFEDVGSAVGGFFSGLFA